MAQKFMKVDPAHPFNLGGWEEGAHRKLCLLLLKRALAPGPKDFRGPCCCAG